MTDTTSESTSENPWGDSPSTIPPVVNDTTVTRRESRRRIRLAAGGIATLVAVGGVAYAQTSHASTATAAPTGTTATTSSSSSTTSGGSSGVSVSSGSGSTAQATSAGS